MYSKNIACCAVLYHAQYAGVKAHCIYSVIFIGHNEWGPLSFRISCQLNWQSTVSHAAKHKRIWYVCLYVCNDIKLCIRLYCIHWKESYVTKCSNDCSIGILKTKPFKNCGSNAICLLHLMTTVCMWFKAWSGNMLWCASIIVSVRHDPFLNSIIVL